MATLHCETCGGEYNNTLPDGQRYFHACPPVRELLDDKGTVIDQATANARLALNQPVYERFVPRPDARDENVTKPATKGDKAQPKANGKGVTVAAIGADPLAGAMLVTPTASGPVL